MLDLDIIYDDIIRGIYAIKINFGEVSSSLIRTQRPKSVNVIPESSNENPRIVSMDESVNTSSIIENLPPIIDISVISYNCSNTIIFINIPFFGVHPNI